jgi:rubrerythrin
MQPLTAAFEDALCALRLDSLTEHDPDGSRMEHLLHVIESHIRGEASALVDYERLAVASNDGAVGVVMRLILEDEERHHGLLGRIATSLRDAVYWTRSDDALPSSVSPRESLSPELLTLVRALIKEEQDGARTLRDLAARERGIDDGLHSILLEMMALDSEKHARLLHFVQRRLQRRSPT